MASQLCMKRIIRTPYPSIDSSYSSAGATVAQAKVNISIVWLCVSGNVHAEHDERHRLSDFRVSRGTSRLAGRPRLTPSRSTLATRPTRKRPTMWSYFDSSEDDTPMFIACQGCFFHERAGLIVNLPPPFLLLREEACTPTTS